MNWRYFSRISAELFDLTGTLQRFGPGQFFCSQWRIQRSPVVDRVVSPVAVAIVDDGLHFQHGIPILWTQGNGDVGKFCLAVGSLSQQRSKDDSHAECRFCRAIDVLAAIHPF